MTQRIAWEIDPTEFFDGEGRFQAYSFAKQIVEEYGDERGSAFATDEDTGTLYFHDGHVWDPRGERVLRKECRDILTNSASRERVNEVVRNVKALTYEPRGEILDLDPEKLVVANGVVDLTTAEFTHWANLKSRPGTLTRLDVEYDEDALPERFNEFLFEILPREDVSVMWDLIGYCLYRGYPFQKAFMLLGDGANGKSTLLAAFREFLGPENVSAVELQELDASRFKKAELEGKLANIAPEISDEGLESTGTFKALTGGDLIDAERKYESPFQFENHATLVFSANQKPAAEDETHAYKRRWTHFKFPNTFSGEDADPQEELLEQFRKEHPGILAMAVESFRQLWGRGEFHPTTYDLEYEDADAFASNPIAGFLDQLERDDGAVLPKREAYAAYEKWADDHGKTIQGEGAVGRVIRTSDLAPSEGKDPEDGRVNAWLGIRLTSDEYATTPTTDSDESTERQETIS